MKLNINHSLQSTPQILLNPKPSKTDSQDSKDCKTWLSRPKSLVQIKKVQDIKLREKFSRMNTRSYSFSLEFFKYLVEISETIDISIQIPETIIIGYGLHSPCLLFNDEKGFVRCLRDLSSLHLKYLIDLFESYRVNNYRETFGPLAILRNKDSQYNRILMKPGEIVLEWKNAYKVDVIMQRFIISKGTKSSKFRISVRGNEVKVLKIVNKARHDLNHEEKYKKKGKSDSCGKVKIIDSFDLRNFNRISESFDGFGKARLDQSFLAPKMGEFIRTSTKRTTDKFVRKSIMYNLPVAQVQTSFKRKIPSLKEYLKSCYPTTCFRSVDDIKYDLINCKFKDHDFKIDSDEMMYVSYYREKITELFTVTAKRDSDVFEMKSQNKLKNTMEMVKEVKKIMNSFILKHENKEIYQLVCDFIEDGFHNTFFSKIKSFETTQIYTFSKKVPIEKTIKCPGKYCKDSGLSKIKFFEVLKRQINHNEQSLTSINSKDYERVKVCQDCYQKYARRPIMRKKSIGILDISFKNMEKSEISSILDQINPAMASSTCILIPPKPTKSKETPQIQTKLNRKSLKTRAQDFFKSKMKEIEKASFEEYFNL